MSSFDPGSVAAELIHAVEALRSFVLEADKECADSIALSAPEQRAGSTNLARYVRFVSRSSEDLRQRLGRVGLFPFDRISYDVVARLDATIAALRGDWTDAARAEAAYAAAESSLEGAAIELLGSSRSHRRTRIMVTLAAIPELSQVLLKDLLGSGMDVVRLNCARDNPGAWAAAVQELRNAGRAAHTDPRIFMDLAGPKLRISRVHSPEHSGPEVSTGDVFGISLRTSPSPAEAIHHDAGVLIEVTDPEVLKDVRAGEPVWCDDGKAGGVVEEVGTDILRVRVTSTKGKRRALVAGRGLNFPDSSLHYPTVTSKDLADVAFAGKEADMVGISFVREVATVTAILRELRAIPDRRASVVLKIENAAAFNTLPGLLFELLREPRAGVLLARGDLAVECGFEKLPFIQTDVLNICRAARLPLIVATEILDRYARRGQPSRAEMTDAVVAASADCVMLNKGDHLLKALSVLDALLSKSNHKVG